MCILIKLLIKSVMYAFLISAVCFFSYCVIAQQIDKNDKHCECIDYDCGCCAQLEVKNFIDGKLCSNFSYLPKDYGISVTITYNDLDIFNETVTAKNPPPICVIHFDKLEMEICLRLYDLDVQNKCFSGCAEFEVEFFHFIPLKQLKLGCFGCRKAPSLNTEMQNVFNYFRGKPTYEEEPRIVLI